MNNPFDLAIELVNRLYAAAMCQALQYGWRTFTFKMALGVGEYEAVRVAVRKQGRCEPTMIQIDGVEFSLNCERGRNAAAVLLMQAVWPNGDDEMGQVLARIEDDPADGRSDYGLEWLWAGYSGGYDISSKGKRSTTMYEATLEADSVPAVEKMMARLEKARFHLEDKTLKISMQKGWVEGEGTSVTYGFNHTLKFVKGNAALIVDVHCKWLPSLPEAIEAATAVVEAVWHRGDLVPGGKGQLNKCKRIGRELWETHGHLVDAPKPQIVVPYLTRGGRGGWKQKTARRVFTPMELAGEPEKTKPKLPGIRAVLEMEARNGWGKVGQRFVRLQLDGKATMRHSLFQVEVEGEWAILQGSVSRYRMPVMDWNRLKVKAKLQ